MMQRPMCLAVRGAILVAGLLVGGRARAFEYPLQFSPVGNYQDLVVAGYQVEGSTVVGDCSYTRITSGSGRDPKTIYTPVPQTCTWDLYGALLSVAAGEPAAPPPLATTGTWTVYGGVSRRLFTGTDSATGGGFVFTWGAHETWLTANAYLVLPPGPYTFTATVRSDGDAALKVSAVTASVLLPAARATVNWTTCDGAIAPGATCDVNVTYDDSRVATPSGLAYDTLTLHLKSNAGQVDDFVQSYTDEVKVSSD